MIEAVGNGPALTSKGGTAGKATGDSGGKRVRFADASYADVVRGTSGPGAIRSKPTNADHEDLVAFVGSNPK